MTAAAIDTAGTGHRRGQLALLLQELLTTTVRLRARPEDAPSDVEAFRNQVRQLVANANREARQLGYSEEDTGYALYAVIAFLDETVLGHPSPVFRPWQGKPLQEEVFGINIGGDVFFQYLEALFAREDSMVLADVLEVYHLCLLLGFRGRYGGSRPEAVHPWIAKVRERLHRMQGDPPPIAPNWAPTESRGRARATDPVQRALLIATMLLVGAVVVGWLLFSRILASATSAIASSGTT